MSMNGITVADNAHSVVIILDKTYFPKDHLRRAIDTIEKEALDFSHVGYVSDEEMKEIAASLAAMTDEDRTIADRRSREG